MRAQTTLDFAIGMSVFLVALTFVFGFVPGMLQPFADSGPESTTVTNRIGNQLVGSTLVEPGEAPVLDIECTLEFFRADPTGSPSCPFDQSVVVSGQHDPAFVDRIGVTDRHRLNVTIEGDYDGDGTRNTLCWDSTDDRVVEASAGNCDPGASDDFLFHIGSGAPPTTSGSVDVARRVVSLAGRDATLEVRVW